MLRCPQCGNTYTDETLRYCLADGTPLVPERAEQSARVDEPATVRIETPTRSTASYAEPAKAPRSFKIILGAIAFVAVVGSVAVVAALIYINKNTVRQSPVSPVPPAASRTATPDAEKERLQRELADAQKKLEEQKNASRTGGAPQNAPNADGDVTAKVNSPNDGFLALRVMPGIKTGEPLAKIPHGETITLGYCQQENDRVGTRDGHWCMTSYDGKSGWVFDAWLDLPPETAR